MSEQIEDEIRFQPTSGRVMGGLAVLGALGVVVIALTDTDVVPAPLVSGAVLFGVLAWASMLWPAVSVTSEHLVLRTMVEHQRLPLAAIENVAVGQVLAVRVGDKRYVSSAIGKPFRKAMAARRDAKGKHPAKAPAEVPYADFVEAEIRTRMERARDASGVALLSDEQLELAAGVSRQPAWLPIGLIAASLLGFVVTVVL